MRPFMGYNERGCLCFILDGNANDSEFSDNSTKMVCYCMIMLNSDLRLGVVPHPSSCIVSRSFYFL